MERHCNICGLLYKPFNKQSLFCSDDCKRLGRNERLRRKTAERLSDIVCATCGTTFKQNTAAQTKFCNINCKQRFYGEKAKKEGKTTKAKLKLLITESRMKQGKCANCEEPDIRLFEFAHFSRDTKTIKSVSTHQCLSDVKLELNKGRWLCVWCHRKETLEENNIIYTETISTFNRRKRKRYVDSIKVEIGSCKLCDLKITPETVSFFEFDHIDPSTKISTIADIVGSSHAKIDAEIAKCRLLCCKCHRLHTIDQAKLRNIKSSTVATVEPLQKNTPVVSPNKSLILNIINPSTRPQPINSDTPLTKPLTLNIIR